VGSCRRRWWPRVVVLTLTAAVGLGGVIAFGVLDTGDKIASMVSCLVGFAALSIAWLDSKRFGPVDEASEAAHLSELSTGAVERFHWEASTRGLVFPEPLRVPWSSVGGPFTASPDVVLGRLPGVRRTALRLQGDVTTLADTVAALPARQVVITGAAGSGKTSAAVLLALRVAGEGGTPVLLDLVAWDPDRHRLDDWLAACLTATRPASLRAEDARAVASRLVERGAVIPVLDGLDELSDRLMKQVIGAVHGWDRPFVLTSRTDEYETAVRDTGLTVARALVVRLGPMPISEITAHLTAGRADADRRWAPVTARLRRPGPLREVLSSPLMSSMAKTAYARVDSDPAELLTFDNVDDLERHLLGCVYLRDEALAWLTALARFLARHDVRQLDLCGPLTPAGWSERRRRVLSLSVIACYLVLITLLVRIEWTGPLFNRIIVVLLWVCLATGFVVIRLATRSRIQTAMPFHFRARPRRVLGGAAAGGVCAIIMMILGTRSAPAALPDAKTAAIGICVVALIAALIGAVAWGSLTEPVTEGETPHPLSAIHWDGWALVAHFPAPILGMAVFCAAEQQLTALPQSAALALIASTAAFDQVPGAAWSRWLIRQSLLARHGLPPAQHQPMPDYDRRQRRLARRRTGHHARSQGYFRRPRGRRRPTHSVV
jgi:hypothetical protein